jgi:hypothetical protein
MFGVENEGATYLILETRLNYFALVSFGGENFYFYYYYILLFYIIFKIINIERT